MPIFTTKQHPRWVGCRGLSRLEFALVVVVVGMLVSVVLSRLSEVPDLARAARLQLAMQNVRIAAQLFHARCELQRERQPGDTCALLMLDGVAVAGVNGWPAASAEGIARAAGLPTAPVAGPALPFRLHAGQRHGRPALSIALGERGCEFFYVQAASPDTPPQVDIVDASCH